jgi:hypothetical protein
MRSDHRTEVVHPTAHGLVRDRDLAFRKQILDVTKALSEQLPPASDWHGKAKFEATVSL